MALFQMFIIFFLPVRVASDQLEVKKCAVFSFTRVISFLKKKREISPKFFKCQERGHHYANQPPILLIQTGVFVLVIKNFDRVPKNWNLSFEK